MDEHLQLCRICISNFDSPTMVPIFGEDSLWEQITTLADVKIEKGDTLPQQVCMMCAKTALAACIFKKKCEDADYFFRHQLLIRKIEPKPDVITISEEDSDNEQSCNEDQNEDNGNGNHDEKTLKHRAFNIDSIRLMNEYMQQQHLQFAKDTTNSHNENGSVSQMILDDEQLPLIPEIEILTPHEDVNSQQTDNKIHGYQCSICYQLFEMKQILRHHLQSSHGTSGPVYECSNCKKTYLYKRFLEKHVRRGRCVQKRRNHTRPMQCSDCHVLFPTGHHLGWHKRTGCPSRASKVPLQQLFKQNIVQYNNFPKKNAIKKPENAFYTTNRKILMSHPKRKGRTRIKLDAKKIALAKQLILKEATTTQIATELNISRTFAWRLRKNLVNGVSLHERVVDQIVDEQTVMQHQQQKYEGTKEIITSKIKEKEEGNEEESLQDNNSNNGQRQMDEDQNISSESIDRGDEEENNFYKNSSFLEINNTVSAPVLKFSDEEYSEDDNNDYEGTEKDRARAITYIKQQAIQVPPTQMFCTTNDITSPQLPVNLSIKPIHNLESQEVNSVSQLKKPRKPNVFIDDEKYELAKGLVSQNSSTMEIARQLNVSQMTAWKLRDAIVKGVPLSYRSKRDPRAKVEPEEQPIQQPPTPPRTITPRRRLKAAEREMRDREITREILEMIKEDSNIQYWKVSARLAEKGFPISPSSVCQKLKALGIHRRWKPGDKPPMLDFDNVKMESSPTDEDGFGFNNDQQFDMGGAHFLSAFTR